MAGHKSSSGMRAVMAGEQLQRKSSVGLRAVRARAARGMESQARLNSYGLDYDHTPWSPRLIWLWPRLWQRNMLSQAYVDMA